MINAVNPDLPLKITLSTTNPIKNTEITPYKTISISKANSPNNTTIPSVK